MTKKTKSVYPLSRQESEILRALQDDGRISNVQLASRVGMSESPCLRRVRALEEAGVIRGYGARLDRRRLGLDILAFVHVSIDQREDTDADSFLAAVQREDQVIECYAMSGTDDYLLKVAARNMDELADLTMRKLLRWPGVQHVSSNFVMEELKVDAGLPVGIS
ncbi:MAG: Lrp/AsnC family transcriptional regulator [Chromatiales bacterium]|nr:MAG: Lrp/AsnC family transcriptional regulator [Chromatiales bacterium]